jgi:mannonate dehydratase
MSDRNLRLAAQAGAEGIIIPYPGTRLDDLLATITRIESFGLKVLGVERLIPKMRMIHNLPGRDEEIAEFKQLITNLGKAGVSLLCYSWMPEDDAQRTCMDFPERGGALVMTMDTDVPINASGFDAPDSVRKQPTTAAQLWENLEYFLRQVLPVAEASGVKLAMHPDDPPCSPLHGQERIMIGIDELERLTKIVPSPSNCICFCQGTLVARADMDLEEAVRRLGPKIIFVHFRDIVGSIPRYRETFIDNGKTDMAAAMRRYLCLGHSHDIVVRPDHVPTMEGETNENPGYEMLGRLHAIGYMQGLMHAIELDQPPTSTHT